MHVSQLLPDLALTPDVEVIVSRLPKVLALANYLSRNRLLDSPNRCRKDRLERKAKSQKRRAGLITFVTCALFPSLLRSPCEARELCAHARRRLPGAELFRTFG